MAEFETVQVAVEDGIQTDRDALSAPAQTLAPAVRRSTMRNGRTSWNTARPSGPTAPLITAMKRYAIMAAG